MPAQIDAILGMVDDALRKELESKVMGEIQYKSKTFQRWRAEAVAEGLAAGEMTGKAAAILQVLEARGVPVSSALRARILRTQDIATLDEWLTRAAVATTASEVVGPAKPAATTRPAKRTTPKRATAATRTPRARKDA
jgi:hypothetical protein